MLTADLRAQLATEARAREREARTITELTLVTPQGPRVRVVDGAGLVNLCSNDYLGLANDAALLELAAEAQRTWGLASAAGRIISGTFAPHRALERELSDFLGTDETMLFSSCFDANAGLFEALLGPDDVIFSDAHNHASIIDGVRLSRARRHAFPSRDLAALEAQLESEQSARHRLIVTDGVFSMDGGNADLPRLCDLADAHEALVLVDDSHGLGTLGTRGRGTIDASGVNGRVDLITGTLGKALGGVGGFISGARELIEALRQTSRPYLFSNSIPAAYAEVTRAALRRLRSDEALHDRLAHNVALMRSELARHGLRVVDGAHPIIPIIVGGEDLARRAKQLLTQDGVLVAALAFPVVARGEARIRVQVSAAHDPEELRRAARSISDAVSRARKSGAAGEPGGEGTVS